MSAVPNRLDLDELFEIEVASVFRFLVVRCGSRTVAEDLTSQTFIAASKHFESGRGQEVTPAWLQTVASRRLVDHFRSKGAEDRRMERLRQLHREETVAPPSEPADDVLDALDSLPVRQRAVLVLRYLDDLSTGEVATALGLSYKATESLLRRARASFAAAYEGVDDGR